MLEPEGSGSGSAQEADGSAVSGDPAMVEALAVDPVGVFQEHPEIVEPLLVIYFLVMVGLLLLVTISIDAQGIAIALLGGIASDRPLRLQEAVVRARQVFWRLAGAGFRVGGVSGSVLLLLAACARARDAPPHPRPHLLPSIRESV